MLRPSRAKDPAVVALDRVMRAGENDGEYDAAIAELETCAAITAQGVRAKHNLFRCRQAAWDQGDRLTPSGRDSREMLATSIDEGLALLTRAGLRRKKKSKLAATPEPTPPGGGDLLASRLRKAARLNF
jgi:hypothetical protein